MSKLKMDELRASITSMGGDVSHLSDQQLQEHADLFVTNVAKLGELIVTAFAAFAQQALILGLVDREDDDGET